VAAVFVDDAVIVTHGDIVDRIRNIVDPVSDDAGGDPRGKAFPRYVVERFPFGTDVSDLHRVRRIADKTVQIDSRVDRNQITVVDYFFRRRNAVYDLFIDADAHGSGKVFAVPRGFTVMGQHKMLAHIVDILRRHTRFYAREDFIEHIRKQVTGFSDTCDFIVIL